MKTTRWLFVLALGLWGCPGGVQGGEDSGAPDTGGPVDTGALDTGAPGDTGAPMDTGVPQDTAMDTGGEVTGDTGPLCAPGQLVCAGACMDTSVDPGNCGMCGRACASGEACMMGTCRPTTVCMGMQTSCGGACVDLMSDPANCGMCGRACAAMETCASGMCRAARTCPMGQTDCGGACVDPQTTAAHCGGCGMACLSSEACMAGSCVPSTCPAGQLRCGTACVNTMTDSANCGRCGGMCAATEGCVGGMCRSNCAAPRMLCAMGGSMVCVDTQADNANCGRCGNACPMGQSCVAGACACRAGQTACAGRCVDTMMDPANCGRCENRCAMGQSCAAGSCTCPTGQMLCGAACTDTGGDAANCGRCGNRCGAAESCVGGSCRSSTLCRVPLTECGGRCVLIFGDNNNCGRCGNACAAGTTCQLGACRPPNDTRAGSIPLALGSAETTVRGDTSLATHDGPMVPCGCTFGADVWYSFTLTRAEIVYFDTAGTTYDSSLLLTDAAGTPLPGQASSGNNNLGLCNDDAFCPAADGWGIRDSQTAAVLGAGTYHVVVGGCASGAFTLHFQHLPTNVGAYFYATRLQGSGTTDRTGIVAMNVLAGSCGGATSGEDVRWFATCGGAMRPQFFSLCQSDGGSYVRREGMTYFDPGIYLRSAQTGAEVACNDDGGSMGGTMCAGTVSGTGPTFGDTSAYGSRLNNVTVPRGLNIIVVDERARAAGVTSAPFMTYTMRYNIQ
ncbi:MAG: hypothetical protein HY909_02035 [Deltaproteobacteria bacterium]|nr:hypothetical protein [Deltaproteobacteria bacterium]